MSVVKEVKGRRVVITDDNTERKLELAQGNIVYLSSEIEAVKSEPLFKQFSEWLFDAKCILPATQLLAVRPAPKM